MSSGVPAGANRPNQASAWKPFATVSSTVGTSGRLALRFSELTASARSLPLRICASTDGKVWNEHFTWPPSRSCTAGAEPR
jgi:hypothetical protein